MRHILAGIERQIVYPGISRLSITRICILEKVKLASGIGKIAAINKISETVILKLHAPQLLILSAQLLAEESEAPFIGIIDDIKRKIYGITPVVVLSGAYVITVKKHYIPSFGRNRTTEIAIAEIADMLYLRAVHFAFTRNSHHS